MRPNGLLTHLFNAQFSGPSQLLLGEASVRPHSGDIPQSSSYVLQRDLSVRYSLKYVHQLFNWNSSAGTQVVDLEIKGGYCLLWLFK